MDGKYVARREIGRYPLWSGSRRPSLRHLDIELTERCDNDCLHCSIRLPANDAGARVRELAAGEWKGILRQAAELGALSVRFTGGEPLLREDFAELYLFARRMGLKVMLFTNARRITTELADLFARIPPLERIEITVYGMRKESYEAVTRIPGSHAEFRRGVEFLWARKVPFVVKGALLPPNRGEMEEFERWAATIPWMEGKPPQYAMFFDLRGRRDSDAKNRRIASLRFSPEEGLAILARRSESYRTEMDRFCSAFMGPPGYRLFACGAGKGGCVDAYGRLQMCLLLRDPSVVCDLKRVTLEEALTKVFPGFRELQATNPDYLARCARCFLKGLCEQCPGKSWAEHGTLDTPVEYLCETAHAQARWLGLLEEGERGWEVADWKRRVRKTGKGVAAV